MIETIISRAEILIQQRRYTEAEKILKDILASSPDDVYVLTLLAEANLQQDQVEKASMLINTAIGISPDVAHLFYTKARIELKKDDYNEAEKSIGQSISLDPADADYYSLLASIKLDKKQYEEALKLANKALELDAENVLGLNIRSTALLKLNHKEDAFITIEGALREDPNNAFTHATYGWSLLEKGSHKKALEHFKEALKINPNFPYAQAGMVEALKANNLIYRLFLKYSFWVGNLTAKYQWGVILGFYFGFKTLRTVARNSETLQPYLNPLIVLLTILAFSTWVITPISNLLLRLNTYGKHLLNKKEIMSSNFVGISFLIFLLGGLGYLIAGEDKYLPLAVFGFTMMLPYGTMLSPSKYKYALVIYAALLTVVGVGAIIHTFTTGEIFNALTLIYILGLMTFQWVANYLLIKEDNV